MVTRGEITTCSSSRILKAVGRSVHKKPRIFRTYVSVSTKFTFLQVERKSIDNYFIETIQHKIQSLGALEVIIYANYSLINTAYVVCESTKMMDLTENSGQNDIKNKLFKR